MKGFRTLLYVVLIFLILPLPVFGKPCYQKDPTKCRIDIELSKSIIKRFDHPVQRISIADPKIADYHLLTPTQLLLYAKDKIGTTNMIVWYDEDTIDVFDVQVTVSATLLEKIREELAEIVPQARVKLSRGSSSLMLYGEVDSQETLNKTLQVVSAYVQAVTNLISVRGSQQVQLSVRIAEVSRTGAKQMGLGFLTSKDFSVGLYPGSGSIAGTTVGSSTNYNGSVPIETTTTVTDLATNTSTSTTTTEYITENLSEVSSGLATASSLTSPFASAFQLAISSLSDDFLGILSVLKSQNLARILASPTLVTMSGQQAEFLVGGEYPIPISSSDSGTTVQFKSYGIMLRFTPTVVAAETIVVQVEPEISNVDYTLAVSSGGVSVPGVSTRRGSTTLQLKDGQTFVMAGLLREDMYSVTNKVPFLGDIPYLGTLFTSKEFRKNETELMIMVTPRLVRALNPDEVPKLPGEDEMGIISDSDFFLKNKTEVDPPDDKTPTNETAKPVQSYNAPLQDTSKAVSVKVTPASAKTVLKESSVPSYQTPIPVTSRTAPASVDVTPQTAVKTLSEAPTAESAVVDSEPPVTTAPQIIGGSGFAK